MKIKIVPIEDAIGLQIAHDLTQIDARKGIKGARFKKGHVVKEEDLPVLRSMGRLSLPIIELDSDELHEDDAALELAGALKGENLEVEGPEEGRCRLISRVKGVVRFDQKVVNEVNQERIWSFAACPTNSVLEPGEVAAAFRILPLCLKIEDMERTLEKVKPFRVVPFRELRVALVTTGSEIKNGLIEDVFEAKLKRKLKELGGIYVGQRVCGDQKEEIVEAVKGFLEAGAQVVICTGGMSVDLEDRTPQAISEAADEVIFRGVPVIPGSNLMLARKGRAWIIGAPACVVHSERTALDRLLIALFAGLEEDIDVTRWGVGGLCMKCPVCIFPKCHFARF